MPLCPLRNDDAEFFGHITRTQLVHDCLEVSNASRGPVKLVLETMHFSSLAVRPYARRTFMLNRRIMGVRVLANIAAAF